MEIFFKVPCSVKTMSKYLSVECYSDIQKNTALLEGPQALPACSSLVAFVRWTCTCSFKGLVNRTTTVELHIVLNAGIAQGTK